MIRKIRIRTQIIYPIGKKHFVELRTIFFSQKHKAAFYKKPKYSYVQWPYLFWLIGIFFHTPAQLLFIKVARYSFWLILYSDGKFFKKVKKRFSIAGRRHFNPKEIIYALPGNHKLRLSIYQLKRLIRTCHRRIG